MLYGPMTHPQLLGALGRAGHSSKILITDGNYPASTGAPATAERIYLNLAPGLLTVSDIIPTQQKISPDQREQSLLPMIELALEAGIRL